MDFFKKIFFVLTIFFACGQFVEINAVRAKKGKKSRKGKAKRPSKKGKKKAKGKKKGKGRPSALPVATRPTPAPAQAAPAVPAAKGPTRILAEPEAPKSQLEKITISAPVSPQVTPEAVPEIPTAPAPALEVPAAMPKKEEPVIKEPTKEFKEIKIAKPKIEELQREEEKAGEKELQRIAEERRRSEELAREKLEKEKAFTERQAKEKPATKAGETIREACEAERGKAHERRRAVDVEITNIEKEYTSVKEEVVENEKAKIRELRSDLTEDELDHGARILVALNYELLRRSTEEATVSEKESKAIEDKKKELEAKGEGRDKEKVSFDLERIEKNRLKRQILNGSKDLQTSIYIWKIRNRLDFGELQVNLISEDIKRFLKECAKDKRSLIDDCLKLVLKKYKGLVDSTTEEIKKVVSEQAAKFINVKNLFKQVNKGLINSLSAKWKTEIERNFFDQDKIIIGYFIPIALRIAIADFKDIDALIIDESSNKDQLTKYLDLINYSNSDFASMIEITPLALAGVVTKYRDTIVGEYKNFASGNFSNYIGAALSAAEGRKPKVPTDDNFWKEIKFICRTTAATCIEFVENKQKENLNKIDKIREGLGVTSEDAKFFFNRFGKYLLSIDPFDEVKKNLNEISAFESVKKIINSKFASSNLFKTLDLKKILTDPFIDDFLPIVSVCYNQQEKIYFPKEFEAQIVGCDKYFANLTIKKDSDNSKINENIKSEKSIWDNRSEIYSNTQKQIFAPCNVAILLPPLRSITKDPFTGKIGLHAYTGPVIVLYN